MYAVVLQNVMFAGRWLLALTGTSTLGCKYLHCWYFY